MNKLLIILVTTMLIVGCGQNESKKNCNQNNINEMAKNITTIGVLNDEIINKYGYKINDFFIALSDIEAQNIDSFKGKKVIVSGELFISDNKNSDGFQSSGDVVKYIKKPKIGLFPDETIFDSSYHIIYTGQMIELIAENSIYYTESEENFLMKFLIYNKTDKPVGVDLTDYWKVIYPNQWGIYNTPMRQVVDETQIIPDTIIDKNDLIDRFKAGKLTTIQPNETISFYRDWNGSGEKIPDFKENEYFIITVDGQLLITNGVDIEQITLLNADEQNRAIVFSYPVSFINIPDNALIIRND